jgi:hypothetical protein
MFPPRITPKITFSSISLLVFFFLIVGSAAAKNWYVRPSTAGLNNGTDWSNAWSISSINWTSVQPGDTIWLAGGTYITQLTPGKAGTAGNPITIKRVLSTDTAQTQVAGWSSSFDSQIVWNYTSAAALNLNKAYITIDGRVGAGAGTTPYGIQISHGHAYPGAIDLEATNLTVQYVETIGAGLATYEAGASGCSNGMTFGWTSSPTNSYVGHVYLHDTDTTLYGNADGLVIERSVFTRTGGNGSSGNYCHGNIFYLNGTDGTGGIFRYNDISQYDDEGILITTWGGSASNWKIYGNIFHDGHANPYVSSYPRAIEFYSGQSTSGFEIYNNTFANLVGGGLNSDGMSNCTSCYVRNNLAYNAGIDSLPGAITSNNLTDSTNPFVANGSNYHLSAPTSAGYTLSSTLPTGCTVSTQCYNTDSDGKTRGADGVWDVGAYEYGTASSANPTAPTGLVATVQ